MALDRSAREVFNAWALDYHADGMEDDHRRSVLETFERIAPSDRVYLEVGVGNGYGLQWMATHQFSTGRCIGIDVSENMVAIARERTTDIPNVEVHQADFLQYLPESDQRPDLIFSMEVFYYLPSIEAGIRHAYELLNPGGTLHVLVNHYVERTDSHGWASDLGTPMQLWSASEYEQAFREAGFVDVGQDLVGVPEDPTVAKVNPGTLATRGTKAFPD